MEFKIWHASDWADLGTKRFDSVLELKKFSEKHKSDLILEFSEKTIIIYDDYIE